MMSGPTGKLPPQPRRSDAGIARGPGLAVAGVTAMIVFVIGLEIFPTRRPDAAATSRRYRDGGDAARRGGRCDRRQGA
jgi:hypothetical protein